MSPRNFARVFRAQVGTDAGAVRRAAARRGRAAPLERERRRRRAVAAACGFGTAESMRRAFLRTLRVAPSAYRARFNPERHRR